MTKSDLNDVCDKLKKDYSETLQAHSSAKIGKIGFSKQRIKDLEAGFADGLMQLRLSMGTLP